MHSSNYHYRICRLNSTLRRGFLARVSKASLFCLFVLGTSCFLHPASAQETEDTKDVSFDDIKFEMEVGGDFDRSMLTEDINDLVGKKIRIRGYIRPSFQQDGIRQFILVRDNQECCFGPGAALYDCVLVRMDKGKSTSYTIRPVAVEGTFIVKEFEGPDGKLWAIYRMVATLVE